MKKIDLAKLLKYALLSVMMFLPILNVAIRCGYVVLNKNAYQSYYGETINETTLTNINSFNNEKLYQFNSDLVDTNTYVVNADFTITYKGNLASSYTVATTTLPSYENETLYCRFRNSSSNLLISFFSDSAYSSVLFNIVLDSYSISFDMVLTSYTIALENYISYFQLYEYNNYSYLDNVFEYSISQLEENNLFNWTENTTMYTAVKGMTDYIGVELLAIPIVLTYWIIILLIYMIINIVYETFMMVLNILKPKEKK